MSGGLMWRKQREWQKRLSAGFAESLASLAYVQRQSVPCPPTLDPWWTAALSLSAAPTPPVLAPDGAAADEGSGANQQISRMGFAHLVTLVGETSKAIATISQTCITYTRTVEESERVLTQAQKVIRRALEAQDLDFPKQAGAIVEQLIGWRRQADTETNVSADLQDLLARYGSRSAHDYQEVLAGFNRIVLQSRALVSSVIDLADDRPSLLRFW